MATIRDLQGDSHAGHGHDDDDDEDQDFFAGGEKSGLAVQNPGAGNPRDQIESMLDRARRYVAPPTSRYSSTSLHSIIGISPDLAEMKKRTHNHNRASRAAASH
jgi:hypothetical protein